MPIYGYLCQRCEHTLDALQKISDDPLTDCPECGEAALKRQLSAPRFRLKGGGWYETDFKTDNQRNLAGDKEAASKDGKSADGKADGKDAKTDGKKDGAAPAKPAGKGEAKTAKPAASGGGAAKSA